MTMISFDAIDNDFYQESFQISNPVFTFMKQEVSFHETESSDTFKVFHNHLMVDIDSFLDNPNIVFSTMAQKISTEVQPSSDKFLWNQESQQIFAKIVTAIGLKGIKPKQITKWMPKRFKLNCQQIGSHLQKYKLRVQRDFQLYSFDQFENWMVPKHLQDPVVEALAAKWLDQRYQGTSQAELMKLSE
ncbi:Conserved_hypothetical protein [Hexamita inflata]|uniref:HTH myb-type domain-containing protein n=1 Tax=Hexamita inflata TaxID=28002 RepID=A0AA86QGU0_9EUKA|nr:Conserved hypothetical protein [Hexamita inflata]CAI9940841.1 Conserved hypothetical protein [Hexamita inflata]CAI9959099.1 Conserved hypothetical protein [Hexamita inflata]